MCQRRRAEEQQQHGPCDWRRDLHHDEVGDVQADEHGHGEEAQTNPACAVATGVHQRQDAAAAVGDDRCRELLAALGLGGQPECEARGVVHQLGQHLFSSVLRQQLLRLQLLELRAHEAQVPHRAHDAHRDLFAIRRLVPHARPRLLPLRHACSHTGHRRNEQTAHTRITLGRRLRLPLPLPLLLLPLLPPLLPLLRKESAISHKPPHSGRTHGWAGSEFSPQNHRNVGTDLR
eukprot:COSAG02_NODE_385_length_23394_cov_43.838807_5_plen_233_part_00